ncbi:mechanosensitive ion channel family protein [soil metagenome]
MKAVNCKWKLLLIRSFLVTVLFAGSHGYWQGALAQQNHDQVASDQSTTAEKSAEKIEDKAEDELLIDLQSEVSPAPAQGKPKFDDSLPLIIDGEEVFRLRHRLGPYSIASRIENIQNRLRAAKRDEHYRTLVNEIKAINQRHVAEITLGNEPLVLFSDSDAKAAGLNNRLELAEREAASLKAALLKSIESHRPGSLLLAAGQTAISAVALFASLLFLNWIFPKFYGWIAVAKGKQIRSFRIQNAELVSDHTLAGILVGLLRIVRVAIVVSLLGIFIPLALSFFPETREIANQIVGWVVQPVVSVALPAILAYLPNIFVILLIAATTYYLVTFVQFIFAEVGRGTIAIANFDPEWANPTFKIIRFLVIAFAFVLIFPYLPGSGSPAFQQVSIFLGVLFSLGSSGAISHLVAGVFLTYTGAFKVGDRVKIADAIGDVVEKTLLATRIRTIKHEYITIPNALVLGSHIINYSSSSINAGLILHTTVTIGYDAPWPEVQAALISAAKATEGILAEPAPFVLQTSLDDFYVSYEINAYTAKPQIMAVIYSDLHRNIQDQFNKAGIEIMSPHYATLRDGNRTTIPDQYLPKDYSEPTFGVKVK